VDEEVAVARLHRVEAAGAGADDAGHPVAVLERHLEARLLDGLVGCRRREPRVAVGMQDDLVALEVLEARLGVEVLDLRADQDLQVADVETLEWPDAKLRAAAAGPEFGHGGADRRHHTHARHHDTVRYATTLH